MLKRYIDFNIPSAVIDFKCGAEFKKDTSRPLGMVFIIINKDTEVDLAGLCKNPHKFYLLDLEEGFYKIDDYIYKNMLPAHLIKFPWIEESEFLPDKSYIEFLRPELLFHKLPESSPRHWRLIYSACSLLPASCPAKEKILLSSEGPGICPFYLSDLNDGVFSDCSSCEVNEKCPKCPYMLINFKDSYCSFHKSGRSADVLNYLKAHFYALFFQDIDLNNLPPVRVEKKKGSYVIFTGKREFTVKITGSESI